MLYFLFYYFYLFLFFILSAVRRPPSAVRIRRPPSASAVRIFTLQSPKPDLLLKVYHASRLHLPLCSTKEQDDAQIAARRKEKLFIDGILLPFPEKLENWTKGSYFFPDMTMSDMKVYLPKVLDSDDCLLVFQVQNDLSKL